MVKWIASTAITKGMIMVPIMLSIWEALEDIVNKA